MRYCSLSKQNLLAEMHRGSLFSWTIWKAVVTQTEKRLFNFCIWSSQKTSRDILGCLLICQISD